MVSPPPKNATTSAFSVLKGAIALIMSPTDFLTRNRDLSLPLKSVVVNYLLVFAAVPLVATIIGSAIFYAGDSSIFGFTAAYAFEVYLLDVLLVTIIGAAIWKMSPLFGPGTNQAKATMLTVFAVVPFFVVSVIDVIPIIGVISYLGLLYGLYILYRGLPILLDTRPARVIVFVLVISVVSIAAIAVIAIIQYFIAIVLASVL